MSALLACQHALSVLKPFLERRDELADILSEVWNALLDARSCIVHKVLDDPRMSAHGLGDELLGSLAGRSGRAFFPPPGDQTAA